MGAMRPRVALAGFLPAAVLLSTSFCGPLPPDGPQPAETLTLYIVNNSSEDVAYVYIAPSGSERWGDDVLGTEQQIPTNTSYGVALAPGTYDIRIEGFQHNRLQEVHGVTLTQDAEIWVVPGE